MSDEQFHEFHLDGKQMVFLFMASTVVAVVIFLCGVMVGRGVRTSRVEAFAGIDSPRQELAVEDAELPSNVDLSAAAPDIPDELTYSDRLQSASPPPERVRPAASAAPVASGRSEASAPVSAETSPAFEPATEARDRQERASKPEPPASPGPPRPAAGRRGT